MQCIKPVHLALTAFSSSLCVHLVLIFAFVAMTQSEDHVSEVEEAMMAQCAERLQQEACKELFKDCTK